jgi:hypothetical protein
LVDPSAAAAFGAGADDEEERVVDADGHPDEEHDRLGAVLDREQLAERTEQPEPGNDGAQCEQDRDERRHQRSKGEQEHEQGDGDREQLRAVQVAVDRAVSCLIGGDVARLGDRQLRVRARRGGHGPANPLDGDLARQLCGNDGGLVVSGQLELGCETELTEAPLDVSHRSERHPPPLCVEVGELARGTPEAVLVHDRVAARGFADGAVVEGLGAADRPERNAGADERDPGDDGGSWVTDAPVSDAHVRPPCICRGSHRRGHGTSRAAGHFRGRAVRY